MRPGTRCRLVFLTAVLFLFHGCGLPRDTDSTLDRLKNGVLRAGVIEPDPEGRALLESFATRCQATVEEVEGSPETLIQALKEGELQTVYGRIDEKGFLSSEAPMSRPYRTLYPVFADNQDPPDESLRTFGLAAGQSVEALWLEAHSSYPVKSDSPYRVTFPSRKPDHQKLDLPVQRYVFLVPPGEHRYLLEMDRFLYSESRSSRE